MIIKKKMNLNQRNEVNPTIAKRNNKVNKSPVKQLAEGNNTHLNNFMANL